MVVFFALVMGLCGLIFYYIGVSMGWLYLFMGTFLGSAVVPIALCITWKKASRIGCLAGAIGGLVLGIMSWLVATATLNNNVINVVTSGGNYPMLTGNLVAIAVGGIISVGVSLIWPEDFNFDLTRAINSPAPKADPAADEEEKDGAISEKKASTEAAHHVVPADVEGERLDEARHETGITSAADLDREALEKAFRFAFWSSIVLLIILVIIIPLALFGSSVVYGVKGFGAWVVIGFIWAFFAAFTVVLYPLWESRLGIMMVCRGIVKDMFQPGSGKYIEPTEEETKA